VKPLLQALCIVLLLGCETFQSSTVFFSLIQSGETAAVLPDWISDQISLSETLCSKGGGKSVVVFRSIISVYLVARKLNLVC
jgi:hypothetical protein